MAHHTPPAVDGLLETAIYARDVRMTAAFYRSLFAFPVLLESDRLIALDVVGKSVLLIFQAGACVEPFTLPSGNIIPGHDGSGPTHFAFAIGHEQVDAWREHLAACNVLIENTVNWPGGATSLYFRDPDQHLVELITRGFWKTY